MNLLAFNPLIDPLTSAYPAMSDHWLWLLIPLVVAISIIYKTIRVHRLADLPKAAALMSVEIIVLMALAAAGVAGLHWIWVHYL